MTTSARALLGILALLAGGGLAVLAMPGCSVGYVLRSGYFQVELLASRQPVDRVRASGRLTDSQLAALDTVADVKAFGREIGLSSTDNYETVALDWDRTIWSLTACDPLAFSPETWWFPIVGRVNYLGYFRESDARRQEARLVRRGLDVYLRTAGTYSTLGWFRDPILLPMLDWSTFRLADTVLHELAHTTVWIPGSVQFNESFANFTGEVAALRYLAARHGTDSDLYRNAVERLEDGERWRQLQHGLYRDLDAAFSAAGQTDEQKRTRKEALFGSLPDRVLAAGFHDPDRYLRVANDGRWNNARMIQFRTYNDDRPAFQAVLDAQDGDLLAFMHEVRRVTKGARDPFATLRAAAGLPANPDRDP